MSNPQDVPIDPSLIAGRRIAVIGYGSQGRAHALNLRDSGADVQVGLYGGSTSAARAAADGFEVRRVTEVARWAEVVSLLVPDPVQRQVYEESIAPNLAFGDLLVFAHGFSVVYGQVRPAPEIDVVLVAPVSPGNAVRDLYVHGFGAPAVYAVWQDWTGEAERLALAYAWGLGCTRARVLKTTFREETEVDLFGEQVVVVGGVSALVNAAFETLVAAGYSPQMAYFECLHQLQLLTESMQRRGIAQMYRSISTTAAFGGLVSGPRIVDDHVRAAMRDVLGNIQDGTFARTWMAEASSGSEGLQRLLGELDHGPIEDVGRELRASMPWLGGDGDSS